jgi:serine/threonine protein kinase
MTHSSKKLLEPLNKPVLLSDSKSLTSVRLVKKKFKIEDFQWIKILGQGSFGIVKLVKHKKSKEMYAIKCLSKQKIAGRK